MVIPPTSLRSCQIRVPKSWGLRVPTRSPLNWWHRAAEPRTPGRALSPPLTRPWFPTARAPPPPPHPRALPGDLQESRVSSLTHPPSALQRGTVPMPLYSPCLALPHPALQNRTTKPTPSAQNPPTHCTAANIGSGCSTFPGPPRPGKRRHVSPVRKCAGRVGCPRVGHGVGWGGARAHGPSSHTSANSGSPPSTRG